MAVHTACRDHCVLKEHQEDLIKCQSASKNMVKSSDFLDTHAPQQMASSQLILKQ